MNKSISSLLLISLLTLAGCTTSNIRSSETSAYANVSTEPVPSNPLIAANYLAANALIAKSRPHLDIDKPIIIATIVDIDNLEQSSTLGRLISEHVSARFSIANFKMVEMKFQNSVYMKRNEGELLLTREIRDIAQNHKAQAVIVGTYSKAATTVFLNLKMIRPESNIVISAQDYALSLDKDVSKLLAIPYREY